jgi:FtsZ-interacting cell division protein ZipA
MPSWIWVLIAIAVVALLAVVVWDALRRQRTGRLQQQFGPEYGRTLENTDSKREAEAELQGREERRERLDIRPLSGAARARYLQNWQTLQAQFVDDPRGAVAGADVLIQSVMAERGYPVEDFEQRAADVSVDYPQVVENYRHGHRLAQASANGSNSTEGLRQAMRHYRTLFEELLETAADQPTTREQDNQRAADVETNASPERTVR